MMERKHRYRPDEQKVERIVSGTVKRLLHPGGKKRNKHRFITSTRPEKIFPP